MRQGAFDQHALESLGQFFVHGADFVEEQRAALGLLEATAPLGGGAG
jgi:hypothetical protein